MPKKFSEIPVYACLEWTNLMSCLCCCCKSHWYSEYSKALEKVNFDVDRSFDVVNLLRRLRLHGFALTTLTEPSDRK